MATRRERILGDIDLTHALGVEIGALHSPLLLRAEGHVLYVDYATTDVLRANLKHPGVDPADVLAVDVVWGDVPLCQALGEPADIIVASHVIEHVPDLLGWLGELHAALRPGGQLGLAVPDRRATFDAWRPDSTIAQVVGAYLDGRRSPSPWQLFEAASLSQADAPSHPWRWETGAALPAPALGRLAEVYAWVRGRGAAAPYQDAHCWVFTPHSFLSLMEALAEMGCFAFAIEAFFPTEPGQIEFQVRMRTVAPGDPAIRASIAAARATMPDPPAMPVPSDLAVPSAMPTLSDTAAPSARPAASDIAAPSAQPAASDIAAPSAQPAASDTAAPSAMHTQSDTPVAPDQHAVLQAQLDAVYRSTSWRVTGPLRRLARMWRR